MTKTEVKDCFIVPAGRIVKFNGFPIQLNQDLAIEVEDMDAFLEKHTVMDLEIDRAEVGL